jgi:hypothetical protein
MVDSGLPIAMSLTMEFGHPLFEGTMVKLQIKADRRNLARRNDVVRRARAAFPVTSPMEMTAGQVAVRLGVGEEICERILAELVRVGAVAQHARGTYSTPRPRAAIRHDRQATVAIRSLPSRVAS